jgi:hypothetical protein
MTLVVNTLRALFDGVAQRLAADADPVLNIAWQASSKYAAGVRGIYPGPKLPTDPDEVIVLSPRQLTADPTLADSEYALNARFRGTPDPHTVWSLASAMRDVFLGRWSTVLPGGLVVRNVTFAGGTPLPPDDHQRAGWSDNYVFAVGEHRAQPF